MFKGLIVYNKYDVHKNMSYIDWLKEIGEKYSLEIELKVIDNNISAEILKELLRGNIFVINRSRNWELSQLAEEQGIRVFNNSEFCILGNDKLRGYEFVKKIGIKYAPIFKESEEIEENKKIIVKPRNGHGGIGIDIVDTIKGALDTNQNIYQEFIDDYKGDIRFYIINNKIVQSVIRKPQGNNALANFSQGGQVEIYNPNTYELGVVNKILSKIQIDYGGIDFLLKKDNTLLFNEFEDVVGSRLLSYLGVNNTTDLFLEKIYIKIKGLIEIER